MIPAALLALLLAPASAAPSSGTASSRQAQAEYLRGTLLERRGALPEALAAYERALTLDPSAAFIAGEAAELALQLDDRERAERWARRRLELAPGDAKSRVILGRVLWSRGDEEGARAELERAARADPSSADILFALAEITAARDSGRARSLIEDFLRRNPDAAARALFELGRLDAQEERYADSAARLRRAIELDDAESGPARLALAQVYEVMRDTPAAVEQYQKLLSAEPGDYELWAHIGELQAAMGSQDEARETFRRLKAKRPDDAAACSWLAADAERGGDFKAAAGYLKDSAALKDDPTLHLRLGYYQLQGGSIKDAMTTLAAARKRWPRDDRVAFYLALGHDDLGEREEAVALLRDVLSIKPGDRDARWQLATILEKMDKIGEAEPEFRRLLADKPDDAPTLNYLGYSLADRGLKLAEAEELIRRALAVEPNNAAYRDSLGWVEFKLGRSTEAARDLAAAAKALPDDDSVWAHLGEARRSRGDEELAWLAFRRAQCFGSAKAGGAADALQKGLSPAAGGELWRRHLEAVHGGVVKFSGVCDIRGRIGGRPVSEQALLSFRAPKDLSLEILGPLFAPAARARLDSAGFSMDPFPVEGLSGEEVRGAAEGVLSIVAAALAGEPFLPGPAKLESGWGWRSLDRPAWRVELGDSALARALAAAGGISASFVDFHKSGGRRIPKSFAGKGRGWEFSIVCGEPKVELAPEPAPPEALRP